MCVCRCLKKTGSLITITMNRKHLWAFRNFRGIRPQRESMDSVKKIRWISARDGLPCGHQSAILTHPLDLTCGSATSQEMFVFRLDDDKRQAMQHMKEHGIKIHQTYT